MKRLVMAAAAVLMTVALMPASGAQAATAAEKKARVDSLMSTSLSNFTKIANAAKKGIDKELNWDHDGCSTANLPAPYQGTFYTACRRHDFGFANYGSSTYDSNGKVKRKADPSPRKLDPTEPRRLSVNKRFKADMDGICKAKSGSAGTTCRKGADAYFSTVQTLKHGATAFYGTGCDNGYFCAYDDKDQKGWHVQFTASTDRLADFADKDLNDNIKSVWNRSSVHFRVFKDPSHKGSTECITKGTKRTLPAIRLRDEVSSIKRGC